MNSWKWPWSKEQPKPRKNELELANHLNELLDASRKYNPDKEDTTRPEKVLIVIETAVKDILLRMRRLEDNYEKRMAELNANYRLMIETSTKAFKEEKIEADKIQNQMILIYDYWYREVEIQNLMKKMQSVSYSTDRKELSAKLDKLILVNAGVEKGIKERKIDPDRMVMLRRKLGIHEDE